LSATLHTTSNDNVATPGEQKNARIALLSSTECHEKSSKPFAVFQSQNKNMTITKAEQFIRTHEIIKARKIASIFNGQKARFVKFLESLNTKTAYWEKKSVQTQLD
jgi:hypothetical protein